MCYQNLILQFIPFQGQAAQRPKPKSSSSSGSSKLARLVRRRESKRDRNAPIASAATNTFNSPKSSSNTKHSSETPSSDNDSYHYGQLKTFESVFSTVQQQHKQPSEMLEVGLRIKSRKKVVDPRGSLIEQMMGIVPHRYKLNQVLSVLLFDE